jgi:hypothetical protein
MSYGHPTTMRYSRTMRQSGTEYASCIERSYRPTVSGKLIVAVVLVVISFAWVIL